MENYRLVCFTSTGISYLSHPVEFLFYNQESMDDFIHNTLPESYTIKSYKRDDTTGQWGLIHDETS